MRQSLPVLCVSACTYTPPLPTLPTSHLPYQAACDSCVRQALQEKGFQCPFPPGACKRGQGHPVGQEQLHPTSYVREQVRRGGGLMKRWRSSLFACDMPHHCFCLCSCMTSIQAPIHPLIYRPSNNDMAATGGGVLARRHGPGRPHNASGAGAAVEGGQGHRQWRCRHHDGAAGMSV